MKKILFIKNLQRENLKKFDVQIYIKNITEMFSVLTKCSAYDVCYSRV